MPDVYLSPSTQGYNPYIIGESEKYYMNLLADAMEPYLSSSGISYGRNDPNGNAAALSRAETEETIGSISPCTQTPRQPYMRALCADRTSTTIRRAHRESALPI